MSQKLYGLKEPFKSYVEGLLKFDVIVNSIGRIDIAGSMCHELPELDYEDARELAGKFREALMPIMREFAEKKIRMIEAMCYGAPPTKDIIEGRLL